MGGVKEHELYWKIAWVQTGPTQDASLDTKKKIIGESFLRTDAK